ncbi:MAG: T9SS type A sorting domain-containing protein, partial [Ignavibacteria bacterium]|nr:T9SS type A sorting domain-containing protein [Ignavibacteria bacterium]
NSFTGWAAGSRFGNLFLLKTSNGGINWSEQNTGQYESSVNGLYFKNLYEGYIVTNLNILRTTNGGLNWSEYIQDYGISSSYFLNDSVFYFSDMKGRLIEVSNTGRPDTLLGKDNYRLDNIFNASGNNLWISGSSYRNFRTTNSGQTWSFDFNSYSSQIKKVFFINANTGFALAGRGKIMRTLDFGNNWQLIYDTNGEFTEIYFLNANTGWVTGNGTIMKTVNSGFNWMISSLNGDIMKMWFSDSNLGFSIMNDSIQKTTDGGMTWNNQNNRNITDFSFLNSNTGWTLNYPDTTSEIRNTTNGGITYSILSRLNGPANKIQFVDELTGYLSNFRSVSRTTNGGLTWKKVVFPVSGYLKVNNFNFINSNTGWFCGDNSLILYTTNGTSININKFTVPTFQKQIMLESYPNPFNNQATINFYLPTGGETVLKIYNICGEEVYRSKSEYKRQGMHGIKFDGTELASGIYFILLKFQENTITSRIMLIK